MHTTPSFIRVNSNQELTIALTVLIAEAVSASEGDKTVIQAGHYHLGWNSNRACDPFNRCYAQVAAWKAKADFAKYTWQAACQAVRLRREKQFMPFLFNSSVTLMTLVNDWQLMNPPGDGTIRQKEKVAAKLRSEYYQSIVTMPAMHLRALADNGLDEGILFSESESQWLFSEKKLRHDLNKTINRLFRDGKQSELVGLRRELTAKNEPVIYATTEDNQELKLLYCGNTGCAGEVVQLLSVLKDRRVKNFINLYPIECRDPVGVGTRLAQNIFNLSDMQITNIAIRPLENGGAEICLEKC